MAEEASASKRAPERRSPTPEAVERARSLLAPDAHRRAKAPLAVCCDFDGVIATDDLCNTVLARFAEPGWLDIEMRWLNGEISSRVALLAQYATVRAPREELEDLFAQASIAPGFVEFVRFARSNRIPLFVLSDGLDLYIDFILQRLGVAELPFFSNRAQPSPQGVRIEFPHGDEGCQRCGVCKAAFVLAATSLAEEIVYVGDGLSDWCASHFADRVYAIGRLLRMRRRSGAICDRFRGFVALRAELRQVLAET